MDIAIISGTSIAKSDVFADWEDKIVDTALGRVTVKTKGGLVALNRHGFVKPVPPHAVNYHANVEALCQLGIRSVVTLSSVGSVVKDLAPGSLVSCSDYLNFTPLTFVNDHLSAYAPVVGNPWLDAVKAASRHEIACDKVYMQTRGPRFETKAEIRAIRHLGAHVVGMTFGNEADLLLERGVELTAFCMVDNYAHGVSDAPLSMEAFEALVAESQRTTNDFLRDLVATLESES